MLGSDLINQIGPVALKSVIGLIFTGLLGVTLWPLKQARREWKMLKEDLSATHSELVQQRTNCLATLQSQGVQQVELLGKTVAALDGVRLDLAEQTGYLKAAMVQPIRRRRTAKK